MAHSKAGSFVRKNAASVIFRIFDFLRTLKSRRPCAMAGASRPGSLRLDCLWRRRRRCECYCVPLVFLARAGLSTVAGRVVTETGPADTPGLPIGS